MQITDTQAGHDDAAQQRADVRQGIEQGAKQCNDRSIIDAEGKQNDKIKGEHDNHLQSQPNEVSGKQIFGCIQNIFKTVFLSIWCDGHDHFVE